MGKVRNEIKTRLETIEEFYEKNLFKEGEGDREAEIRMDELRWVLDKKD